MEMYTLQLAGITDQKQNTDSFAAFQRCQKAVIGNARHCRVVQAILAIA